MTDHIENARYDMSIDTYDYIFHYSEYRSKNKRWACIHRKDSSYYWNGIPFKGSTKDSDYKSKIGYGDSPYDAFYAVPNK